jgi:EXLDI family protein
MPNKTIYVSQDDVSVYDEAKQKAGSNLSSVISGALREYVGRQDSKQKGFSEVVVTLGSAGYQHEKRFMGKRLLGSFSGLSTKGEYKGYSIYETPKKQYVVVQCELPDPFTTETGTSDPLFQAMAVDDDPKMGDTAVDVLMGYGAGDFTEYAYNYKLTVCPTLESVAKVVPGHTYKNLTDKLEQIKNPVEYLDV